MSTKKTSTKKTATKKAPAKKAAAPKATTPAKGKATKPDAKPTGECIKGGDHKWTEDKEGEYCIECLEPKPKAKQGKAKATTPAAEKKDKAKTEPKDKKLSAIDAAVQVLAASKEPLSTKQMIEAMGAKGLWTSPGGKTPHATLYSAILREINEKGKDARFTKTERGRFAANAETNGSATTTDAKPTKKQMGKAKVADGTPGPKSVSKLFKI